MYRTVEKAIHRYLKRHYPNEIKSMISRSKAIMPGLKEKAPDLGGSENTLANNFDMFLLFISYYEATDHRMGGEAIDEIINDIFEHKRYLGVILNANNKPLFNMFKNLMYKSYRKYADTVMEKQSRGKWLDTWGMIVAPRGDEGFSFTLVGCPIAEYAEKYGYHHLMPHMCALDHAYAKLMHTKLIRTHTVATGADSCDYWYVPDKSNTAKNYNGVIF